MGKEDGVRMQSLGGVIRGQYFLRSSEVYKKATLPRQCQSLSEWALPRIRKGARVLGCKKG
jgi:hypothetical protein